MNFELVEGTFVDYRLPQTRLGHSSWLDGPRCFFGSEMKRKICFSFAFRSLIRTFVAIMSTIIYPSPIFGPVHSRRLGLSLGINLLPADGKVCSFDCIYCECGFNEDHRPSLPMPTREEVALALEKKLQSQIGGYESMYALWGEFDASLVSLKDVQLDVKKVAGVRVPVLLNIELDVKPFGLFSAPKWYFDGINLLQGLAKTAVEREFVIAKLGLLDHARRKTTQKVNLFEKVQIPGYQEAIRKIKRFMEDEENLSKSSQKILKSLQEARKKKEEEENDSSARKEVVAV
jgi:V/A-type H+-transporting ATPase subunit D